MPCDADADAVQSFKYIIAYRLADDCDYLLWWSYSYNRHGSRNRNRRWEVSNRAKQSHTTGQRCTHNWIVGIALAPWLFSKSSSIVWFYQIKYLVVSPLPHSSQCSIAQHNAFEKRLLDHYHLFSRRLWNEIRQTKTEIEKKRKNWTKTHEEYSKYLPLSMRLGDNLWR